MHYPYMYNYSITPHQTLYRNIKHKHFHYNNQQTFWCVLRNVLIWKQMGTISCVMFLALVLEPGLCTPTYGIGFVLRIHALSVYWGIMKLLVPLLAVIHACTFVVSRDSLSSLVPSLLEACQVLASAPQRVCVWF